MRQECFSPLWIMAKKPESRLPLPSLRTPLHTIVFLLPHILPPQRHSRLAKKSPSPALVFLRRWETKPKEIRHRCVTWIEFTSYCLRWTPASFNLSQSAQTSVGAGRGGGVAARWRILISAWFSGLSCWSRLRSRCHVLKCFIFLYTD